MNVNARESSDMRTISLPFITQCNSPRTISLSIHAGSAMACTWVMVLPATRHTADESVTDLSSHFNGTSTGFEKSGGRKKTTYDNWRKRLKDFLRNTFDL